MISEHAKLHNQWSILKATLDLLDYCAFVCDESGAVLVADETASARAEHCDGV